MVGRLADLLYELLKYVFDIFVMIWPLLLFIFAWRAALIIGNKYGELFIDGFARRSRFKKIGNDETDAELIHRIRTLHPREFEFYVAEIFNRNGYKTKVTGRFGQPDGGVDIVARKGGIHTLVQCKKFIDQDVGIRHIREFYGVGADQRYMQDAKLVFVSTTYFTESARKFAKEKDIKLVDADYLVNLTYAQERKGLNIAFDDTKRSEIMRHVPPACPVCSKPLVWRHGPHGDFIGCKGYPICKYAYSRPNDA